MRLPILHDLVLVWFTGRQGNTRQVQPSVSLCFIFILVRTENPTLHMQVIVKDSKMLALLSKGYSVARQIQNENNFSVFW